MVERIGLRGCGRAGIVVAALVVVTAQAEDWTAWRGPRASGISSETGWNPSALNEGADVLWRAEVGRGYSSVSVKAGRLYTMGNEGNEDTVYAMEAATGMVRWKHSYPCSAGSYPGPRATPVLDGDSLYTVSREGYVLCLNALTGAVKWEANLHAAVGAGAPQWGHAASACVEGDLLILNACQAGVALDKQTGKVAWKSEPGIGGYATPVVFTQNAERRVAIFGAKALHVVDLASGKSLASYGWETSYDVNAADPIAFDGHVFISSGYGRGAVLLSLRDGELRPDWTTRRMKNHFSSCVLIEGHLYGIDGNAGKGDLVCLSWESGEEAWRANVGFGASMAADGKLVVLTERGTLLVAEAVPDAYHELARAPNVLPKTCWTVPVLSDGRIYCRNNNGVLVCVSVK